MRAVGVLGMLVVALLAGCGAPPPPAAPVGLTGDWNGSIEVPGQPLRFGVRFAPDGTATVDIPAQQASGIAVTNLAVTGSAVRFGLAGVPGDPTFTGTLSPDGGSVSGDYTRPGRRCRSR